MQYKKITAGRCPAKDFVITLILWAYFTVGFVFFFAPFYVYCFCFSRDRQAAFQKLNSRFYRIFFLLCRILIPKCKWRIDESVTAIRGSVLVCNHRSYLDSILLISLFDRHSTIVKNRLFKIPLFGTMLRLSGYLPADSSQGLALLMINRMERLYGYLADGGNLIVFPQGTRGKNGVSGEIQPGAFKIAAKCKAPVKVLVVQNTGRLFTPGKFCFNTCRANDIKLTFIEEFFVEEGRGRIAEAVARVRDLFQQIDHDLT